MIGSHRAFNGQDMVYPEATQLFFISGQETLSGPYVALVPFCPLLPASWHTDSCRDTITQTEASLRPLKP